MTKNTLAAALMAGVVGVFAGIVYLLTVYGEIVALIILGCLAATGLAGLWIACQGLAGNIIEARRKRGDGAK